MKFDHNGIGKLADAQSCTVTEKKNGSYELKLICPADGIALGQCDGKPAVCDVFGFV